VANVLVINSSLQADNGNSGKLTQAFVNGLSDAHTVVQRDLGSEALPHLTAAEMGAWIAEPADRSTEQQTLVSFSDTAVAELNAADVVVLGVPMYNFGVPSQLKTWIDRVARAGVTFKYTETGPVGLLADKKVVILAARGGVYQGTPADTQTPYLQTFFNFLGLSDLHFVYAEGQAMPDAAANMDAALSEIATLASSI
jgi:FMN-dependent NADH-azoreductase